MITNILLNINILPVLFLQRSLTTMTSGRRPPLHVRLPAAITSTDKLGRRRRHETSQPIRASKYGPVRVNVPVTWSGNVWDDTGKTISR